MKIDNKKVSKLKQLDRIEFRQRYTGIYNKYDYDLFSSNFIYIFCCLLILDLWSGIRIGTGLLQDLNLILEIMLCLILFDIIIALIFFIIKNIKLRELEKEYFKIEIKSRRKD